MIQIKRYITINGKVPFSEWLDSLQDQRGQAKIKLRLNRIQLNNLGDCKFIEEVVYELRINYGPGYRIYFAQIGLNIFLLLCGGDKSTQTQDIRKAIKYLVD